MIPWILLDKVIVPGDGKELRLFQRGSEFSIKVSSYELMNSYAHNSEDALAKFSCLQIGKQPKPQILIGGLGMGFTLRAALNNLSLRAQVTVAELIPAVVKWNRSYLAHLAGSPLKDNRVTVYEGDVSDKIKKANNLYNAILLDVDNGAKGLTQKENDSLYSLTGLNAAYAALNLEGVLAIWSAAPDKIFSKRLQKANFKVKKKQVPTGSGLKRGGQAVVWIATKH